MKIGASNSVNVGADSASSDEGKHARPMLLTLRSPLQAVPAKWES